MCFVATAAFNNENHPGVRVLKSFRDEILLAGSWGAAFVDWYYQNSPPWAAALADRPALRFAVQVGLAPLIGFAAFTIHVPFWMKLLLAGAIGYAWIGIRRRRRAEAS